MIQSEEKIVLPSLTQTLGLKQFVCGKPKLILLFSGKRKAGKDFVTDLICERVQDVTVNLKISGPIKSEYAKNHGLNYDKLMSSGSYKEQYRLNMIKWSEEVRNNDHGFFCRSAIEMFEAEKKPIWIVSDVRRRSDLKWFRENFTESKIVTVRILSSEEQRIRRGWTFTAGIDDAETECDLDSVTDWDLTVVNNTTLSDLETDLKNIVDLIRKCTES